MISQGQQVRLELIIKDSEDTEVDRYDGENAVNYTHGSNAILPTLEEVLEGKGVGDIISVTLAPDQSFGDYSEDNIQRVSMTAFEEVEDLEPGMTVFTQGENGSQAVKILEIEAGEVQIDTNHPLAGKTLTFDMHIIAVGE